MRFIFFAVALSFSLAVCAQKTKTPAAKGVVYGTVSRENNPVSTDQVETKLVDNMYSGQIKGKVVDVCRAEGCWLKLEKADGTSMMVRAKDHAFLMPESIVGKTVLVQGSAAVKETTEAMRKHYAEDAGKSKEEIAQIKGDVKDVQFNATGVKVLD